MLSAEHKIMKKLLLSLACGLVALTASAQDHAVMSMLNVRALFTGTNSLGAGAAAITNLLFGFTNGGAVLSTNVVWTNNAGQVVRSAGAAGGTNIVNRFQLFKSVPLATDRNGLPMYTYFPTVASNAYSTNSAILSPFTIQTRLANPYGSNGPVGITFTPLWDGTNMSSNTERDWTVVIGGLTTAVRDNVFNVPTWLWPGAKAFTVRTITNEFNPTAAADVTNCPALIRLDVVGFRP